MGRAAGQHVCFRGVDVHLEMGLIMPNRFNGCVGCSLIHPCVGNLCFAFSFDVPLNRVPQLQLGAGCVWRHGSSQSRIRTTEQGLSWPDFPASPYSFLPELQKAPFMPSYHPMLRKFSKSGSSGVY